MHVLVFGASSGIGQAIAARFKRGGAVVSGFARRPCSAEATTGSWTCDVTDTSATIAAVSYTHLTLPTNREV